jgi:hypothetical protein
MYMLTNGGCKCKLGQCWYFLDDQAQCLSHRARQGPIVMDHCNKCNVTQWHQHDKCLACELKPSEVKETV